MKKAIFIISLIVLSLNIDAKQNEGYLVKDSIENILKNQQIDELKKKVIEIIKNDDLNSLKVLINNDLYTNFVLIEYKEYAQPYIDIFLYAIAYERYEIVEYLINKGVDINRGKTLLPIHLACSIENIDIVRLLIENNVEINKHFDENIMAASTSYNTNWTALHYAVDNDNFNIVKILITYGSDPNILCPESVLHRVKSVRIAKYLIENNANVNSISLDSKYTPLMSAISCIRINKNYELIEFLLINGANINYKSKESHYYNSTTAREIAVKLNDDKILKLLDKYGSK